jgi:hypothetical protein
VSRRTEAKTARRKKRRAARDERWIPEPVLGELVTAEATVAAELELFDERITERGWTFDDEKSDEEFAFWLYGPSVADISEVELTPVTTIWMSADEDAEIVHLMFVGTTDQYTFMPDELYEHLDAIEAYRFGDPLPAF